MVYLIKATLIINLMFAPSVLLAQLYFCPDPKDIHAIRGDKKVMFEVKQDAGGIRWLSEVYDDPNRTCNITTFKEAHTWPHQFNDGDHYWVRKCFYTMAPDCQQELGAIQPVGLPPVKSYYVTEQQMPPWLIHRSGDNVLLMCKKDRKSCNFSKP